MSGVCSGKTMDILRALYSIVITAKYKTNQNGCPHYTFKSYIHLILLWVGTPCSLVKDPWWSPDPSVKTTVLDCVCVPRM